MSRHRVPAIACSILGLAALLAAGPAHAEPAAPHHVTYTVTAATPATAEIYFRQVDPPDWAAYSHNPYVFSPKVVVDVGPGRPWVLHTTLIDPNRWAMVSATSGRFPGNPAFRCELAVDGVVVATGDGPKGALCSLRHW